MNVVLNPTEFLTYLSKRGTLKQIQVVCTKCTRGGTFVNSDTTAGMLMAAFGAFFFVFVLVIILLAIGLFAVKAFGLYRLAQRKEIEHAWLAWIPFAQTYLYAELIGQELTVGTMKIPQFPWAYIAITYGSSLIAGILSAIPLIGWLLAAILGPAIFIASIYVMYRFFMIFEGDNATVNTVICALFPVVFPIMILVMREKAFAADAGTIK